MAAQPPINPIAAAEAIGRRRWHIMHDVLRPEAYQASSAASPSSAHLPGEGRRPRRHGDQRFDTPVMAVVVTLLIAQLWLFQFAGDTALATL